MPGLPVMVQPLTWPLMDSTGTGSMYVPVIWYIWPLTVVQPVMTLAPDTMLHPWIWRVADGPLQHCIYVVNNTCGPAF